MFVLLRGGFVPEVREEKQNSGEVTNQLDFVIPGSYQ
jgi:hypothetical protein